MTMHNNGQRTRRARRGFSLIELLVTMAVIAIVIAIIVPTLGGARNTAKAAGTQSQLTAIGAASQQFYSDQGQLPGFFTARQMGHPDNETRGFTGMQNIMLDLAGGIVSATGDDVIEVGPTDDNTVLVDLTRIGTREAGGGYYTPDDNRFVAQEGAGVGLLAGEGEHQQLRSVVDPFGTPILAWEKDSTAIQELASLSDFSAMDSGGDAPARFYWASNAGFLRTQELGKRGKNPTFASASTTREYSLIGDSEPDLFNHMAVLLGSPTIPNRTAPEVPSAARGSLIFHSAGIDAMYMGSKDTGGRASTLAFWQSFYADAGGSNRLQDADGKVESIDLMDGFDDQLETVGN